MIKKILGLCLMALSLHVFAQEKEVNSETWKYHEKTFADGKSGYTATKLSNDGSLILLVSNGDRETLGFTIFKEKVACESGCDVLVSFDNQEPEKIHFLKGNVILFATFDESRYLINKIIHAKTIQFNVPSGNIHLSYTVKVDNLDLEKLHLTQ